MYKVQSHVSDKLVIDDITIPSYSSAIFKSFKDNATVNKLINNQKISIFYVDSSEIKTNNILPEDDNIQVEVSPEIQEAVFTETISSNRRRKSKEPEAEKSNLMKGDMTNATD